MSPTKILLTGATGYIGGTVLSRLLKSNDQAIKNSQFSVLIRGENKAKAFSEVGVNVILFESLDQVDVLEKAASEHDVVIHTASGFHTASAVALIKGLAKRKARVGGDPRYIHTSGTGNLADQPITGAYHESRAFSDKDDIYSYFKTREAVTAFPQRTTDIAVIETGREVGIETYIIESPLIYGVPTDSIEGSNTNSVQVPALVRAALKTGHAEVIGEGKGIFDYVQIDDLAALYEVFLLKVLQNAPLPSGEQGIYFSAAGRFAWKEIAQYVADAGYKIGALKTNEVKSIGLEEAGQRFAGGSTFFAELAFAGNSRSISEKSRELGWKPTKTLEDFKNHFEEQFSIAEKGSR